MTCREIATPGQCSWLLYTWEKRPIRTEGVLHGAFTGISAQLPVLFIPVVFHFRVPTALLVGEVKLYKMQIKRALLCFIWYWWSAKEKSAPEGTIENKCLTSRGHKVFLAVSFSIPHFSIRTNFPPWLDCLLWGRLQFPPAGVLLPTGSSTFCTSRTADSTGTASRSPNTHTPHNLSDW